MTFSNVLSVVAVLVSVATFALVLLTDAFEGSTDIALAGTSTVAIQTERSVLRNNAIAAMEAVIATADEQHLWATRRESVTAAIAQVNRYDEIIGGLDPIADFRGGDLISRSDRFASDFDEAFTERTLAAFETLVSADLTIRCYELFTVEFLKAPDASTSPELDAVVDEYRSATKALDEWSDGIKSSDEMREASESLAFWRDACLR